MNLYVSYETSCPKVILWMGWSPWLQRCIFHWLTGGICLAPTHEMLFPVVFLSDVPQALWVSRR